VRLGPSVLICKVEEKSSKRMKKLSGFAKLHTFSWRAIYNSDLQRSISAAAQLAVRKSAAV